MKKFLLILLILVSVIFAGCFKQNKNEQKKEDFSLQSINEAFDLKEKIICEYKIDNDKAVISVDGEKYKVETDIEDGKYYTIYDGKYFYSWTDAINNGFKIEKSCYDELYNKYLKEDTKYQENLNDESNEYLNEVDEGVQDQNDFDNAYDINCKHVNSIDLTSPNDINFSDYCQTIKDTLKIIETIGNSLNSFDF